VARDTFHPLASDTGDLAESSVAVLDRLFAGWDANKLSVTLAPPSPNTQKTEEPASARPIPGEAVDSVARREVETEPWWAFQRLAWGSAVALALVSGRLGRRRKPDPGADRVSLG